MKISKLTTLVFVLGAILYSPKVDAQNVPNILESGRESRLLLVQVNSQDPKTYIKRGEARLESGDSKGAIEDYSQAIQINPNDAEAYHKRGFAGSKLASVEIFLDFNDGEAYLNRSAVQILSGDLKGAIENSSQALRLNPNYALAYNNRGFARLLLGDLKEAIEDFTQALRIDPSLALAQNNQDSNPGQLEDVKGSIINLQKVAKLFKEEGKIAEYQYTLDLIKRIEIQPK